MSDDLTILRAGDGALEITLRRPNEGNVLTAAMTAAIQDAVATLADDVKLVMLQTEGADFCAGRQSPMPPPDSRPSAGQIRVRVAEPVLDFYAALRAVPVPVLARVRGRALGVGCALAGLADLAIAAESAVFGVPEMDRDIPPLLVMTALSERLPRAALARLVLSRDAVPAPEAERMGLVGLVVPDDRLDAETARIRGLLAGNSLPVLRTVKRFLNAAPEVSYAARRELAAAAISAAVSERFHP